MRWAPLSSDRPDGVDVLLERGLGDLLGRLVQPGVDDLETVVAQRSGDGLRSTIVAIEARLRDDDSIRALHEWWTLGRRTPSTPTGVLLKPTWRLASSRACVGSGAAVEQTGGVQTRWQPRSNLARAVLPVVGGLAFFALLGVVTWGIASLLSRNPEKVEERLAQTQFEVGPTEDLAGSHRRGRPAAVPGTRRRRRRPQHRARPPGRRPGAGLARPLRPPGRPRAHLQGVPDRADPAVHGLRGAHARGRRSRPPAAGTGAGERRGGDRPARRGRVGRADRP